jgi:GT2 family glycosyltransferase
MDAEIKATVIVVGWNGKRYLKGCLSSILDQDVASNEYEVLFVDNHSADCSVEWVRANYPLIQVIALDQNLGFYAACDRVTNIARGRYLVVVPQDTIVHRRWLTELIRAADENERAVILTANAIGPETVDYMAQTRIGPVSQVHYRELSRLGHVTFRTSAFVDKPFCTLACSGVSGLFKRALIEETGHLFEPLIWHYAGDMEAGLRATVLGYTVLCVPSAVVYHVGDEAKSLADLNLLCRYALGSRDALLAYYKNMTLLEFLIALPLLILGRSAKTLELRVRPVARIALLLVSFALTPALLAVVLVRLPRFASVRKDMAAKRRVDRLWLLRRILFQHRGPGGKNDSCL